MFSGFVSATRRGGLASLSSLYRPLGVMQVADRRGCFNDCTSQVQILESTPVFYTYFHMIFIYRYDIIMIKEML